MCRTLCDTVHALKESRCTVESVGAVDMVSWLGLGWYNGINKNNNRTEFTTCNTHHSCADGNTVRTMGRLGGLLYIAAGT